MLVNDKLKVNHKVIAQGDWQVKINLAEAKRCELVHDNLDDLKIVMLEMDLS